MDKHEWTFELPRITEEVDDRLEEGIDWIHANPLIAKELLKTKHRKPKGADQRYVTLGSPSQAFLYWKQQGAYWVETPGALDFLRNRLLLGGGATRR
jgi:hypothetical protein